MLNPVQTPRPGWPLADRMGSIARVAAQDACKGIEAFTGKWAKAPDRWSVKACNQDWPQLAGRAIMKKKTISHQEINQAIKNFLTEGGLIKKLPDQEVKRQEVIGEDKYEIYEPLSNLPIVN